MTNDYKEKILEYLKKATEPADVEKIRIACGIGNWNTALKHCLELHSQGTIQGQKTSKGWVFWIYQETYLASWEEALGTLDKVENSETQTVAFLTCTYKKQIAISLPKNQPETQKLQKLLGQKIAILKTDIPEKPLIIRTFTAKPVTQNCHLQLQLLRKTILCWLCWKIHSSQSLFRRKALLFLRYVFFVECAFHV
jgi:hypothetical protein